MNCIEVNDKRKKIQKIYRINQKYLTEFGADTSEELEYSVQCPICNGRIFDLSGLPQNLLRVRLKCPRCRRIVEAPIVAK